jgi:hypothetical protein
MDEFDLENYFNIANEINIKNDFSKINLEEINNHE